jgi:septum site-determining protein MinC
MSAGSSTAASTHASAELKADTYTLPTLCLSELNPETIDELLYERTARAPDFFRNTPVVLDITNVKDDESNGDLAIAVGAIRGYGMVPIGVRGGSQAQCEQASLMELAVFPKSRRGVKPSSSGRTASQTPPSKPRTIAARIVDKPVRSGQRIYAQGGDLILLAPVSSGAEVVADGHVHAYAPIRGRVLAGVLGDESACVFCKDLNAELVSIAGRYKVNEDLEPGCMGCLISVSLRGDTLIFKKL